MLVRSRSVKIGAELTFQYRCNIFRLNNKKCITYENVTMQQQQQQNLQIYVYRFITYD